MCVDFIMSKSKLNHDLEAQANILLAHNALVVLKLTETLTTPVYKQLNDELLRLKDVVATVFNGHGPSSRTKIVCQRSTQ